MKLTGPPGTIGVLKAMLNACRIHTTPMATTITPRRVLTIRPKTSNAARISSQPVRHDGAIVTNRAQIRRAFVGRLAVTLVIAAALSTPAFGQEPQPATPTERT